MKTKKPAGRTKTLKREKTMKIKVRAFGDLISLLGSESTIELETDAIFKDLISKLTEKTDSSREGLLEGYEVTGSGLVLLLNGRNIHALKKLQTPLKDGDLVTLLPPAAGG